MNPLFGLMMNMGSGCMFSPFTMGMNFMMPSLFCGCSNFMTMPYYQNDNLGFLNFPIMRNTSADYLLDPNLALRQCQMNWQNGGGMFGTSILPGFSFPQIAPIGTIGMPTLPGMPGVTQPTQKTEEERKAEEEAKKKKEEQDAKPEAKEAKKCYELFNSIKKLAEDKTNLLPAIPEELSKKAEEAMKKETAEEQHAAMQEVLSSIPADTLRKAALANDEVRTRLRKAGYNFGYDKYSLKDPNAYVLNIAKLETDIKSKTYTELQLITGELAKTDNQRAEILGIISAWNNAHNTNSDRGIIRYIASNIPAGEKEETLLGVAKSRVQVLTESLLTKADEYSGYEKIAAARKDVSEKLEIVIGNNGFNKTNLNKLADAFDRLYVRLRMQEAVAARDYVKSEFGYLNNIHPGTINDNTIIEETAKDLRDEGLTPLSAKDLDKAPERQQIQVQERVELRDLNEQYEEDGKALLETLASSKYGYLTKVEDSNYPTLYQTKSLDAEDGNVRYFAVSKKDNKVYELYKTTKTKDGQEETVYLKEKGAASVSAEEIGDYDATVQRVNKWYSDKVIGHINFNGKYPIFYATGNVSDKYTIKGGKFYHIVGAEKIYTKVDKTTNLKRMAVDFNDGRKGIYIDDIDINSNDLEEVTDINNIKTEEQVNEEKRRNERKDADVIESRQYSSIKDIAESNEEMDKIAEDVKAEITADMTEDKAKKTEVIFRKVKTGVQGYFYCETKNPASVKYYKYNIASGKLEYLEGVKDITVDGYMVKENGRKESCIEVILDSNSTQEDFIKQVQEYGSEFRTLLNGGSSPDEVKKIQKKLNTMLAINQNEDISAEVKADYIINFIKGYQGNWCLWSSRGMCKQIVTEDDIPVGSVEQLGTGRHYIKIIAEMLKNVVAKTGFDRSSKDYETLCAIADGNILTDTSCTDAGFGSFDKTEYENLKYTAEVLDDIIDKIIEAYNTKCGIKE